MGVNVNSNRNEGAALIHNIKYYIFIKYKLCPFAFFNFHYCHYCHLNPLFQILFLTVLINRILQIEVH